MYRKVILEFLSSKHLELSKNDYFQMTICQIGASYQGTIQEMLKKSDEITIYHIKEPRIYQKTYDFCKIDETIISMILDIVTVEISILVNLKPNYTRITFENAMKQNIELYNPISFIISRNLYIR